MSIRTYAAAAIAAAGLFGASAAPAAAPASGHSCFFITEWRGWKAPTPDVLYLGVGMHDVYKVELTGGTSQLQSGDARLISRHHSGSVCSALDLDLQVSDGHGFSQPLIARSLVKLTPEEVAAIPPKFRP